MNFERMPKKTKWVGKVVTCVVLIAVCGTLLYFRENLTDRIAKVFASTDKDPIPVAKLERQPFSLTVTANGEITGLETTTVNTPNTSAGQLTIAWLVPEGTFVNAGDLVVRFDSTTAQLDLESRQNTLAKNRQDTSIRTQQIQTDERNRAIDLRIAEENYHYSVSVMPEDESIFSRWDIISAAADERYDRENLEFMRHRIRTQQRADRSQQQVLTITRNQAQTEVNRIENTLNSLELRAPVGGLVLYFRDRRAEPAVGDRSSPGQTIMEIINLDALQARIHVLERDGGFLERDLPVNIRLDAVPEKVYTGVIRTVSAVAQSLTRNSPLRYFTCEVTIVDASADLRRIRPGMLLRADVVLQEYESVFIVPSGAVTERPLQSDTVVHIQVGQDRFEQRVVEMGLGSHGEAVILSGVNEGETIALVDPAGPRQLSLPDFNATQTTGGGQPKAKIMMMGPGGGMPGGMGGMGGMGGGRGR